MNQSEACNTALDGALAIRRAFDAYRMEFDAITRRAKWRFERRDWRGAQLDAVERLDLYRKVVAQIVSELPAVLKEDVHDRNVWAVMRSHYAGLIAERRDPELAKTFFNSITRRVFVTMGVDESIEFVGADFELLPVPGREPIYRTYVPDGEARDLIRRVLQDLAFAVPYQDLELDARLVADHIEPALPPNWGTWKGDVVEMLRPVFYRNKGAYLIGRIRHGSQFTPLVLALLNDEGGVYVDAVLTTQDEVSIVFSFTRSYFHVAAECPHELIDFLKSIMPLKRVAELYIAIGYNKHGKTELYRDLLRHLMDSADCFEPTAGDRGMVMVVFTLPSYDVVFKVIRDRFAYPKTTTRQEVMDKYQLVFRHDRAGRLVDAQEYEHWQFDRRRFSPPLLKELLEAASSNVTVDGDSVAIKHLYTERRLTPLNLYLADHDGEAGREAVLDYGQAVKDLAATNIFPGDLLLKNFGVTRHGRVVFYDYDELCQLTDCNFRELPTPPHAEEEFEAEPWFYVGPHDIFPEEFMAFLGFRGELKQTFLEAHGDLLGAAFWNRMQARHRAGEVMDIFPYKQSKRLRQ